ncbi:MAG: hypothetical protein QOH81_1300 [Sphingomonadales bacterium]|jgi:hypothetical protein|nr:hypothetical protein [Sphingomonadales bacterium]
MRWFKPFGLVFYPVSAMGWLATLFALAFCAHIFLFVDHRAHSVTDALYGIFPYWGPTLLALAWIADRTGGRRD